MTQSNLKCGFIGLGVMGEPMCRNLAVKSGHAVLAFDVNPAPLARLQAQGVAAAESVAAVTRGSDVVFLSLPSGEVVREIVMAPDGVLSQCRPGQIIVDLSTSPVDLTRDLARSFAERGVLLIDAPVARTRAAAEAGTLSVTVGADAATFERVKPLLGTFATDITLCGPVGCGQVVKILNNMVLFETVTALSEAKAIGERAGVPVEALFNALSKGSADSFALRNHGMKAIAQDAFPEKAFPVSYARKDLGYALRMARHAGVDANGAKNVDELFERAQVEGFSENYWPVISRLFDK